MTGRSPHSEPTNSEPSVRMAEAGGAGTWGPATWGLGLAGSLCAHLAVFAGLLPYLHPDPPPQQPSPESALMLSSQRVSRSQAQEQTAPTEPGKQVAAKSDSLSAGNVPQTKAVTTPAKQQNLDPARVPSAQITPSPPLQSTALSPQPAARPVAARPPSPQNLQTTLPEVRPSASVAPNATNAAVVAPPSDSAKPVAAGLGNAVLSVPMASQVGAISPNPVVVSFAATDELANPLPEAPAQSQSLAQSSPQVETIMAALAFQGGETNEVDPLSLAAFQSFTRPGDLAGQAAEVRDGLAGLLSAVPCARLQLSFDSEATVLELRGHLPDNALRAPVLAALQAQMGRDIAVSDQMRLLPRPVCGALSGISTVGLPQSTDQITNPLLLGADAQARVLSYSGGEKLFFDLTAPDYPAYLYVDYFDAAGEVIHLSPNASVPLQMARAKSALRVGTKSPADPGLHITVGPPYGQEIAVAFAASSPLYEGLRPLSEAAPAYLEFLREKIAQARAQDTDFKGEWVYFLIETQPK